MNKYYKVYSKTIFEDSWTLEETFSDFSAARGFGHRKPLNMCIKITEVDEKELEIF